MADAPEKIWIEQDDCPYFYEESELTEVGSPVTEYVRADLYAALEAQLAARTGAVKAALSGDTSELIDRMAAAIREDGGHYDDAPWDSLSDERKEGWRGDARRALAVVKEYLTTRRPSPEGHHPDDIAVDRFAAAMKEKLARKREEGRGGWDDKEKCSGEYLSRLLREHVDKGDPVDVGNLAMMLHQRGERIAPEGQQPVGVTAALSTTTAREAVRMKPLEWRNGCASTSIGDYLVVEEDWDEEPFWFIIFNGKPLNKLGEHKDEASAIAAAQADYERRILSALSPAGTASEMEPVAWEGYWDGAGSISSETRYTRSIAAMEHWAADGAKITPLYALPPKTEGWQPIETAPKDGTTILCYFPLEGLAPEWCRVVPVFFHRDRWTFASRAASGFSSGYEPTHWRPLPAPPKAGQ